MKTREIENALLLRDSGELTEAECRELEIALKQNPEMAELDETNRVLQFAGTFSSAQTVPPLSELTKENILQSARKKDTKKLPRLLAIAAMLILGFGLLPHFRSTPESTITTYTAAVEPVRSSLDTEDPFLNSLEELENELAVWVNLDSSETAFLENENDWAELLLSTETSI